MKDYFKVILINIIGLFQLILFLIGFFEKNQNYSFYGGIGTFIFISLMIVGQSRNQRGFLFAIILGCVISLLISKWYNGFFWVSAIFSVGQIPGFFLLLSNRKEMISIAKLDNPNQRISILDLLPSLIQIFIPYLGVLIFI
jgi:hypothetical protein